ncbi:MAG TPA: hypothetical protein VGU20_22490 [Stellaceae bacterium]|nr:hypothetical protein [Stellaceae bacterium]
MRSFILACVAAVALAVIGALVLNLFQEPLTVAFSTEGARP